MKELKICTKCHKEKLISEFYKDKQKSSGYRPDCKECNIKTSTNWQKNNRDKHHGYEMKRKYGMKHTQYSEMLKAQNNKCAICNKEVSEFKTRFHVDHNHTTGKIRELLCVNCNHGIGSFMEDKNLLEKAIKYLEKWN
jgi:hypothetical protein